MAAMVAAAEEVQETLRNVHLVFAADSEEVQREWLKFTHRVRAPTLSPSGRDPHCLPSFHVRRSVLCESSTTACGEVCPELRCSGQVDDQVAAALRHAVKRSLAELAAALHGTRRLEVRGLL